MRMNINAYKKIEIMILIIQYICLKKTFKSINPNTIKFRSFISVESTNKALSSNIFINYYANVISLFIEIKEIMKIKKKILNSLLGLSFKKAEN